MSSLFIPHPEPTPIKVPAFLVLVLQISKSSPSRPRSRGQGADSQILRWGTEKADAEGVEADLDASPDAVKLYERHGFREAGKLDTWIQEGRVEGQWYRNVFMVREPQRPEV